MIPAGEIAKKSPKDVSHEEAQELVKAIGRLGRRLDAFYWRNKIDFSRQFILKLQRLTLEGIEARRLGQKWGNSKPNYFGDFT